MKYNFRAILHNNLILSNNFMSCHHNANIKTEIMYQPKNKSEITKLLKYKKSLGFSSNFKTNYLFGQVNYTYMYLKDITLVDNKCV